MPYREGHEPEGVKGYSASGALQPPAVELGAGEGASCEALALYRQIAENAPDPLVVVDRQYIYHMVNAAYLRFRTVAESQVIGHRVPDIVPPDVYERIIRPELDRCLAGETTSAEAWIDYPGIGRRYVELRHYPLRVNGRIEFAAGLIRDITGQKQAEGERERLLRDLQAANAHLLTAGIRERELAAESERRAGEAEAALQLRDQFLSVAAHELKTPLSSLKGQAELTMRRIERGCLPDLQQVHHALRVIDRQVDRLSALVAQLLDISRIQAGELELERHSADLVAVARGVVTNMQASTERHTIALHAPESLVAYVDPLRLEQVLFNLIDNAIRYSPQGGRVEVTLSMLRSGAVRLAVRDHGIGIPPEQREHLFQRFFQAARRPAGGLGLGLYASRRIVELHGGRIWAEFPDDGGSRFVVELPREPTEQQRT